MMLQTGNTYHVTRRGGNPEGKLVVLTGVEVVPNEEGSYTILHCETVERDEYNNTDSLTYRASQLGYGIEFTPTE